MKKIDEYDKIVFYSGDEIAWVFMTFNDHIYQIVTYLDELRDIPLSDVGRWGICSELNRESFEVFGRDECLKLIRKLAVDNDVI